MSVSSDQIDSEILDIERKIEDLKERKCRVFLSKATDPHNPSLVALANEIDEMLKSQQEALKLKNLEKSHQRAQQINSNQQSSSYHRFKEGDYCYGLFQGFWYVGVVEQVMEPDANDNNEEEEEEDNEEEEEEDEKVPEYIVRYVGYGNTSILNPKKKNIKPYFDPPEEYFSTGTICYAVFGEDQTFYEAVIDKLTEDGTVFVTFKGYGNVQETPLAHVRLTSHPGFYASISKVSTPSEQSTDTNGKITHTEDEKKKEKKKKKKKNKPRRSEIERIEKQKNWQSFLKESKSKKGVKKKESMFKSTAQSMVGVIHGKRNDAVQNNFVPLAKSKPVKLTVPSLNSEKK